MLGFSFFILCFAGQLSPCGSLFLSHRHNNTPNVVDTEYRRVCTLCSFFRMCVCSFALNFSLKRIYNSVQRCCCCFRFFCLHCACLNRTLVLFRISFLFLLGKLYNIFHSKKNQFKFECTKGQTETETETESSRKRATWKKMYWTKI